jgi:hypothetical protein
MGQNSADKSCLNFGNGSKDSKGHTFTTSSKSVAVRNEWIQAVLPRRTKPEREETYREVLGQSRSMLQSPDTSVLHTTGMEFRM